MTTVRLDETKVILPRCGQDDFWNFVQEHFAHELPQRWKYLAMLALRENAGWPVEKIGMVFGHPKGHVTRCLRAIKIELRNRFDLAPEWLAIDGDDPQPFDECLNSRD